MSQFDNVNYVVFTLIAAVILITNAPCHNAKIGIARQRNSTAQRPNVPSIGLNLKLIESNPPYYN